MWQDIHSLLMDRRFDQRHRHNFKTGLVKEDAKGKYMVSKIYGTPHLHELNKTHVRFETYLEILCHCLRYFLSVKAVLYNLWIREKAHFVLRFQWV